MGKLIHSEAIEARIEEANSDGDILYLLSDAGAFDVHFTAHIGGEADEDAAFETGLQIGMTAEGKDVVYVSIMDQGEPMTTVYWIGTEKEAQDRVEIFLADLAANRGEISTEEA